MVQFLELLQDVTSVMQYRFIAFYLLYIYLMSWVPSMRETGFGRILGKVVEPYLAFFRQFIPPLGMIDISPIVAIFALRFISGGC